MYRESLQNNRDRILLSKHLATIDCNVPIEFSMEGVKRMEPDTNALKQVYKEMEFFSLLKELGPTEDAHTRDYQVLDSAEAAEKWLAAIPAGAVVAVSVASGGEDSLAVTTVGLSFETGEGRSIAMELLLES